MKNRKETNLSYFKFGIYLIEIIPKFIKSVTLEKNELSLEVDSKNIKFILNFLKNHLNTKFNCLITITAIDYPEKEKRFEVNYLLLSLDLNFRIRIYTYTDEITPLESIISVYKSASWYEREVWDMFGVFFSGHSDLRRILTDYGFEGFPLRKDFPQTGYVEVRYDDEKKYVVYEPLEVAQEYRAFDFNSSWLQVK